MINMDKDGLVNNKYYKTSDLKLQAFLRLMHPDSFVGVNRDNSNKVIFIFRVTSSISELRDGYLNGNKYEISPLAFANKIDEGKGLIYGDYGK
jgi:hypothetical protein